MFESGILERGKKIYHNQTYLQWICSVKLVESYDIHVYTQDRLSLAWTVPAIGINGTVSRTGLRYRRDYMTSSNGRLIMPAAIEKISPTRTHVLI